MPPEGGVPHDGCARRGGDVPFHGGARPYGGILAGGDLDRLIEEALRYTTPTPVMLRSVAAPARVGRVAVRPGDRIVVATLNCTRAYGPFDPARRHPPELRRLWFGAGPHFCIGYPLALAEIRAVTELLLAHDVEVVARRPARRVLLPAYRHLWIRSRNATLEGGTRG